MKRFQVALAALACSVATAAMATPSATYSLNSTNASSTTGGVNTSNGKNWNDSNASYYGAGGTNYGNTYTWNNASSGSGPSVTMSAWGTTTLSTTVNLQKAWIGNYGTNGFGITSQSSGELNSAHDPDTASPYYQHAIDDYNAYESLMFSFASAVTLNSLSIGFKGGDADATVLEYKGTGNPTSALTSESYSSMLCASSASTNCWTIVGNLLNMATNSQIALPGGVASQYWMVGAYLPVGSNAAADANYDSFKVSGFVATRAVPEPDSIALFGIAAAGFVASRRRRAHRI